MPLVELGQGVLVAVRDQLGQGGVAGPGARSRLVLVTDCPQTLACYHREYSEAAGRRLGPLPAGA